MKCLLIVYLLFKSIKKNNKMSLKNLCISHFIINGLSENEKKLLPIELNELLIDIQNIMKTINNRPEKLLYDMYFYLDKNEITNDIIISHIQERIKRNINNNISVNHEKNLVGYCYRESLNEEPNPYYSEFDSKWHHGYYEIYHIGYTRSRILNPTIEVNLIYDEGNLEYISMTAHHTNNIKYLDTKLLKSNEIYKLNVQMSKLYTSDPIFNNNDKKIIIENAKNDPRFSLVQYTFIDKNNKYTDKNNKYTIELPTYYPIPTTIHLGEFVRIPLIGLNDFMFNKKIYISIYPQVAKILKKIPIEYIYSISSTEIILKKNTHRIFSLENISIDDIINIITIYHPSIIEFPSYYTHKLFKKKYNKLKIYIESVIVLLKFRLDIFVNLGRKMIITDQNKLKNTIKTKYLYIQIENMFYFDCLNDVITEVLIYFNCDTIIMGRQKFYKKNPDTNSKFIVTFEKFNNLIIINQ